MPTDRIEPDVLRGTAAAIRMVLEDPMLELEPGTRLDDLPGLDSMNQITIGLHSDMQEIDRARTVGDLAPLVAQKQGG